MSNDDKILGGTPVVDADDAIEFFTQRGSNPCPNCGHKQWNITRLVQGKESKIAPGLVGTQISNGATLTQGLPVVITTCKKCAYLRMHDFVTISKWIAEGKPEFKEDE
jgi:hypothetical protein